jgi:hypothetical protein
MARCFLLKSFIEKLLAGLIAILMPQRQYVLKMPNLTLYTSGIWLSGVGIEYSLTGVDPMPLRRMAVSCCDDAARF